MIAGFLRNGWKGRLQFGLSSIKSGFEAIGSFLDDSIARLLEAI